jgi:hypothetical protein
MIFSKRVHKLIIKTILANEKTIDFEYDDCREIRVNGKISIYPYNRELIHFHIGDFLRIEYTGETWGFSVYDKDNEELDIDSTEYDGTPVYRLYNAVEDYITELLQDIPNVFKFQKI